MPTKDLQRWNQDGANMKAQLEKAGYVVDLQYANNDIATQVSQIENMITGKCNVLVVASIDGSALKNALDGAKKKRIPVIAYDRLIMNTNSVSYYATFDNYKVGTIQGEYLVDKLNLKNRTKSDPAYIEFFTGSPDDNNINFFFGGAMDILKPYLDSGVLVCRSGQTSKAQFHEKPHMIPREDVERITGDLPGGVCPFAIPAGIPIWLDISLKRFETVHPAGGDEFTSVAITPTELAKASGAIGWCDVCKGWLPD